MLKNTPKVSSKARRPESQNYSSSSTSSQDKLDELNMWRERVVRAEKLRDDWAETFQCRKLHAMWAGPGQLELERDGTDSDDYYVTLFFSSIEARRPSLVFRTPYVRVRAKPARTDDPLNTSEYRAKLYEDTINTILTDPRVGVLFNASLALHEAFFRFGCVEVGITSEDVTSNPRASRPPLSSDESGDYDDEPSSSKPEVPELEPEYLVTGERPYVRWIPAEQVFISASSNKNDLWQNDFIGYCDYVRIEDIEANPFYKKVKDLRESAVMRDTKSDSGYVGQLQPTYDGRLKLYKVWDLRTRKRHVFCDTGEDFLLNDAEWKILPLCLLKFHEILNSYYPLPPTFNWIQPQRDVNRERNAQRTHTRRFNRKYLTRRGKVDPAELDKLVRGEDGTIVQVQNMEDINPLQDAPQDPANDRQYAIARQDFTEVSSVGPEERQIAESETATQAQIINTNKLVRDSFDREQVATWLVQVARTLLAILYEQASVPFWIYTNVDPASPNAQAEAADIVRSFQLVRPEYLADYAEWELTVDLTSMLPQIEERDKQNWLMMLQTLSAPQMQQLCLASDVILRQTLAKFNIRAEKEVLEIKGALQRVMTFNLNAQAMAAAGQPVQPPIDASSGGKPTPQPGVQGATPMGGGNNIEGMLGQLFSQAPGFGGNGAPAA